MQQTKTTRTLRAGTLAMAGLVALLMAVMVSPALAGETLDVDDPVDAIKATRKIMCSLEDGQPVMFSWQGKAFGRMPGERDKHLFNYEAYSVRACVAVEGGGAKLVSRELLIYLDPKTGEVVDTWTNPYIDKDVEVVHVANDPVNHTMMPKGRFGPYRLPLRFNEGTGYFILEVPLFYTNPLGGKYQQYVGNQYHAMEIFNFFIREDELYDESAKTAAHVNVAWTRISPWLPWMQMGSRVGGMVFSGAGVKIDSFDDVPEMMQKVIEERYPDYKVPPPLDDKRPNETSWTVFKKHIDAKTE